MNSKHMILTNMPVRNQEMLVCAVMDQSLGRPEDFFLYPPSDGLPVPGEIYIGKIDRLHRQTDGAFVRLSGKQMVYMPLHGNDSCDDYVMKTRRERGAKLRAGDELILQIDVTAQKTKLPRACGELNLPGRYLAFTTRDPGWHYSRKLNSDAKNKIRDIFEAYHCDPGASGVIVRTNAADAAPENLLREFTQLRSCMEKTIEKGRLSAAGTCLFREAAPWSHLLDRVVFNPGSIIETDRPELFAQLQEITAEIPAASRIIKYEDHSLPLHQLYGLRKQLEQLTAKRVWLKSGASVIIEQTEAFVSVDVNSGKFTGTLSREEMALKINLEAATEILRHLRLRQLSGMILVDFINMKDPEHLKKLLQHLREAAAEDPVRTSVVDITALGIVEITREKRYAPLAEQISRISG